MTRDEHDTEATPSAADVERFRASLGFAATPDLRQAVGPWEERDLPPARGQIRLGPPAGPSAEQRRDLFVVGEPFTDFGKQWWTATALDTEVEAGADADAALAPSETDLGVPLRLRTDHAAPLPAEDLGGVVATLDTGVLDQLERGALEPSRFGLEHRGTGDWRLAVDPDAWRRWLDRRAPYDREAQAFATAQAELERRWIDLYRRAGDAVRRRLPDILGNLPAPGGPSPAASSLAPVIQGLAQMSPHADVALAGMEDEVAPADAFWPVSLQNREALTARVEPVGAGARIRLDGLPDEVEGLRLVVSLPMATGGSGDADWLRDAPGLLLTEDVVRGGRASVVLRRVETPDEALIRDLVVLPPLDVTGEEGET